MSHEVSELVSIVLNVHVEALERLSVLEISYSYSFTPPSRETRTVLIDIIMHLNSLTLL